jgi:hypothetical protein
LLAAKVSPPGRGPDGEATPTSRLADDLQPRPLRGHAARGGSKGVGDDHLEPVVPRVQVGSEVEAPARGDALATWTLERERGPRALVDRIPAPPEADLRLQPRPVRRRIAPRVQDLERISPRSSVVVRTTLQATSAHGRSASSALPPTKALWVYRSRAKGAPSTCRPRSMTGRRWQRDPEGTDANLGLPVRALDSARPRERPQHASIVADSAGAPAGIRTQNLELKRLLLYR